jgi:hypothetical protein
MARPFTYISSQMYYDLEIYFFRLALYTDSDEYLKLIPKYRKKIDEEIIFMNSMLHLMQIFRQRPVTETPVVAWRKEPVGKFNRVLRFSSLTTAGRCLDITTSHIAEICRGKSKNKSRKGWVFQYETDYNEAIDRDAEVVGKQKQEHSDAFKEFLAEKSKDNYGRSNK